MRNTLEITTHIGCPNNCIYCPQDKLLKAYKGERSMTTGSFKRILQNTPKDIQIDFTGFCEPFINRNASWMMRYAAEQGYDVVLVTTLTGFTEHDADILCGVGFKTVLIHEYEGTAINYDIFDAKEILLRNAIITDKYERFRLTPEYRWSRAGNLFDTPKIIGRLECGWTGKEYYRNVVLPNGNVYLCCMDYSLKHCLGNLFTTHYNDLNRKQITELCSQEDSDCICRYCEIAKCL